MMGSISSEISTGNGLSLAHPYHSGARDAPARNLHWGIKNDYDTFIREMKRTEAAP